MRHIEEAGVKGLYSFRVKEDVAAELCAVADEYRQRHMQGSFKSLDVMRDMGY